MKVLPRYFQRYLSPVNTLTDQMCSKTGAFRHLSNDIFRNQKLLKYLSYEADLFLQNALNFM